MKRLVGLFVLATLLVSPLGSLATRAEEAESNVVWSWSAEEDELEEFGAKGGTLFYGAAHSMITATESAIDNLVIPDGSRCIKFQNTGTTAADIVSFTNARIPSVLKAGKLYKFSFWWYSVEGGYEQPLVEFTISGTTYKCTGSFVENCWYGKGKWMYFETYLVAPDEVAQGTKHEIRIKTLAGETVLYDDFKLEEYDDAAVRFMTGTAKPTPVASYKDKSNSSTPQTGRTVSGATVWFYPVLVGGTEKVGTRSVLKSATTVNVLTAYVPKSIEEETALIVAVFGKNEGTDTLQDVIIETQEYKATPDNAETPTYYYYGDNMIQSLPVDISGYGECTLKAFMWSSVSGLKPLGESAVLGA